MFIINEGSSQIIFLENYGRVLRDCAKCLEFNPRNVKALYRSARALLALDRVDEAHDCCEHALAVDETNAAVRAVKDKCLKRKEQIEAKQRQKEERERREKEEKDRLEKAFQVNLRLTIPPYFTLVIDDIAPGT